MGAYFLVVNPAKRQYLDPSRFGEAYKFSSVLQGDHVLLVLKLLICDCLHDATGFRGAWLGDPVILAGDDGGLPDPGGLATTTPDDPGRNLHALARAEYVDISYRSLVEICLERETAEELADRAKRNDRLLLDLGGVLDQYQAPNLEFALETAVGRPWRKAHDQARAKRPGWEPLPPVNWVL